MLQELRFAVLSRENCCALKLTPGVQHRDRMPDKGHLLKERLKLFILPDAPRALRVKRQTNHRSVFRSLENNTVTGILKLNKAAFGIEVRRHCRHVGPGTLSRLTRLTVSCMGGGD